MAAHEANAMQAAQEIVEAVEAFVSAAISYERRLNDDREWASCREVGARRDHLTNLLAAVLGA